MTPGRATIRPAVPDDGPAIVTMVHELADYERELDSCHLTEEQLATALFGPAPALFGHVGALDGQVVACALWFLNFSTWRGGHGIHLEDLYVRPEHRGRGIGRGLLAALAGVCRERGFARLEWSVLDWNAPSIAFYRSIGAAGMDGWTTFRLDGDALVSLNRPSTTDETVR